MSISIFLKFNTTTIPYFLNHFSNGFHQLMEHIKLTFKVTDFWCLSSGKMLDSNTSYESLRPFSSVLVLPRLRGGKGGFGSLLRNQAATKRKITNWDSSRDLTGRKIRFVNNEQKALDYLRKLKDQEKKIKNELDNYNKYDKIVKDVKIDIKLNQQYKEKLDQCSTSIHESVLQGMKSQLSKKAIKADSKQAHNFQLLESILMRNSPQIEISDSNNRLLEHSNPPVSQIHQLTEPQSQSQGITSQLIEKTTICEAKNLLENQHNNTLDQSSQEIETQIKEDSTKFSDVIIESEKQVTQTIEQPILQAEEQILGTVLLTGQKQSEGVFPSNSEDQNHSNNKATLNRSNESPNIIDIKSAIEQKKLNSELLEQQIDLKTINSLEELKKIDNESLKKELMRLGLKCGGRSEERAQRLWDVKLDPKKLFDQRYLAKVK